MWKYCKPCTVITMRVNIAILLLIELDSEEGWCVIFVISKKPKKPKQIVLYIIFSFYQSKDIYIYIYIYIYMYVYILIEINQSFKDFEWNKWQGTIWILKFGLELPIARSQRPIPVQFHRWASYSQVCITLYIRLCLVRVKVFPENILFFGNAIFRKGKCFHVFGCISKNVSENIFWCLVVFLKIA